MWYMVNTNQIRIVAFSVTIVGNERAVEYRRRKKMSELDALLRLNSAHVLPKRYYNAPIRLITYSQSCILGYTQTHTSVASLTRRYLYMS